VDDAEFQYGVLRHAHASFGPDVDDIVPGHRLSSGHPWMAKHPKSKFPFDQRVLFSDPRLEGRLSNYLIRLEFTIEELQDLLEEQSQLPDLMQ